MLTNIRKFSNLPIACLALISAAALSACSRHGNERTASGTLDTSIAKTSAIIDAAGPGVQVTRTDFRSMDKATEYRLTPFNFSRFMAAADSVATRQRRDPAMRQYLAINITDAGSTEADAGLKWLAASPAVTSAINSAGMSVRDYFVASIAIARRRAIHGRSRRGAANADAGRQCQVPPGSIGPISNGSRPCAKIARS